VSAASALRSRRTASLLALFGLAALSLWSFRDVALFDRVLYERDVHLVWEPTSAAFARAWRLGSWPLWDDSQGFGQSLAANPQAQLFYPPAWLAVVVPFSVYSAFYVVGHTLGSAWGGFLLGRRLGCSPLAAFTAAALWTVSGPFLSSNTLWHHFAAAAWLPWVLLGFLALHRRRDATGVALASLAFAGQILAGSADLCALTLVAAAALVLVADGESARAKVLTLARAAAAVVLALALTSPLWLTSLQTLRQSARSELAASSRTFWSVHPVGLFDLLLPVQIAGLPLREDARAALFDSREPFIPSLYLGLGALPLVAAGFTHPRRRLVGMFAVLGLLALLVSLGRHAPVYGALTVLLPPLRILRYPVKALYLAAFAWSVLAGLGVDALREREPAPRRLAVLLLALAATLGVVLAQAPAITARVERRWLLAPVPPPTTHDLGRHLALGAAALALAGFAVAKGSLRVRRGASAVLVAVAVADLVAALAPFVATAPRSFYAYRPAVLRALGGESVSRVYVYNYSAVIGKAERHLGRSSLLALRLDPALPATPVATALSLRSYLFPATAASWGLHYGFDVDLTGLAPREIVQLHQLLWATEDTPAQLRLLRLGSVSHLVTLHDAAPEGLEPAGVFRELLEEPVRLWRVPDPLPRILLVGGARVAAPLEALALIADGNADPRQEVVLSEGEDVVAPADFRGSARFVEERPGVQKVEAEASHAGYLVVLDTFAPGWRAEIDGRDVPVLRANGVFRAIALPPGRHEIVCRYVPDPLVRAGVPALALFGALLGLVAYRLRAWAGGWNPRRRSVT
jgi:hypothetical protein